MLHLEHYTNVHNALKPTPGYDCHISSTQASPMDVTQVAANLDQVQCNSSLTYLILTIGSHISNQLLVLVSLLDRHTYLYLHILFVNIYAFCIHSQNSVFIFYEC